MHDSISKYIHFFETISPESLTQIDELFSEHAVFQDPFNQASGHTDIRKVFEHMFKHCQTPKFNVNEAVGNSDITYLRWVFEYGPSHRRKSIEGVSRVTFDDQGRAKEHIDYWDPAKYLYERIPIIGFLLKRLRLILSSNSHNPVYS